MQLFCQVLEVFADDVDVRSFADRIRDMGIRLQQATVEIDAQWIDLGTFGACCNHARCVLEHITKLLARLQLTGPGQQEAAEEQEAGVIELEHVLMHGRQRSAVETPSTSEPDTEDAECSSGFEPAGSAPGPSPAGPDAGKAEDRSGVSWRLPAAGAQSLTTQQMLLNVLTGRDTAMPSDAACAQYLGINSGQAGGGAGSSPEAPIEGSAVAPAGGGSPSGERIGSSAVSSQAAQQKAQQAADFWAALPCRSPWILQQILTETGSRSSAVPLPPSGERRRRAALQALSVPGAAALKDLEAAALSRALQV